MGFNLKNAFNKFADVGNSLNHGVNSVVGKEVFKDINKIEDKREFAPFESYPKYSEPEPEQWQDIKGEEREFLLDGNVIHVSANLDNCLKHRKDFEKASQYYTEQFKFKYHNCVNDFDSFVNYFSDMYIEGLIAISKRAYSLLLTFGVFNADMDTFISKQTNTYNSAVKWYETIAGIELQKNQNAENLGNQIGGAVQMRGGGFGMKGAVKGMAKAEAFNFGMGAIGKLLAHQGKMTQEEKSQVFEKLKADDLFVDVHKDYFNVFFTFVQTLSDNNVLGGVTTIINKSDDIIYKNLQNPMFPQDKLAATFTQLISTNPFVPNYFKLLEQKIGKTPEVEKIINYFEVK